MPVDVVMPQMGESIAEGTVIKWMKKVGDAVERDEPIFEISTDKVDAEIPSPAAGILSEILVEEGQTVAVNSVVARLTVSGESAAAGTPEPAPPAAVSAPEAEQAAADISTAHEIKQDAPAATPTQPVDMTAPAQHLAVSSAPPQEGSGISAQINDEFSDNVSSLDERKRTRSSPLVRKIAQENSVDIGQIDGTGVSGRVTKDDILKFIENPRPATPQQAPAAAAQSEAGKVSTQPASASSAAVAPAPSHQFPPFGPGESTRTEPLSRMRKSIAEHMVASKRTSAHVTTVFEIDFTEIDKLRKKNKASYAERGANLTFLPFITQSVLGAIREFPILNSSLDGDNIVYKNDINIGIAVALEWGLIVPVIKKADEKNILGLARSINELGERARTKKLNPDDVQGGTFTITNPGVYGGLFGTPIINQPQVAILCVGGVKKRPVVIETPEGDAIVIRSMCMLSLTFDHRLIDGAVADQFMARVKKTLEAGQFAL